jgi:hypothetical protein
MSKRVVSGWVLVALLAMAAGGCGAGDEAASRGSSSVSNSASTSAVTATAVTTTAKPKLKRPRFDTVHAALKYVAERVDVPVVVPSNLPDGTTVRDVYIYRGSAQLGLRLPGPRGLTIQYGKAGFDGCGPLHPRAVRVGDNPAVIEVQKLRTSDKRFDGHTYTTLVWPATLKDLDGRYALSGIFSERQILAFAESMEKARAASPRGPKSC